MHRILAGLVVLLTASALRADDARLAFFESRIRPVLAEHCYGCHSAEAIAAKKLKGGLRVDTRAGLHEGGDSGPAVVPGKPGESELLAALRFETFEMPPTGRLPANVIADFEKWIADGAVDPREDDGSTAGAVRSEIDFEAGRAFWAFRAPERHDPPDVSTTDWGRAGIDPFVLARMEAEGLAPAEEADRETWLRRVTFDLTGLPPTPEEVDAFLADAEPEAYERVVDRLLAAPAYGEHLARLWLDVARYAEDQAHIVGNNKSLFYPNAYLYRDWVIRAFNEDLPYDRFVRLQLAADLVEPDDPSNLAALGFLGLGPKYYDRKSKLVMVDEWENQVDTVTRGLLGVTVACARCHDHKFDPIGTADFHALAGVFASTTMTNRPIPGRVDDKGKPSKKPEDAMHVVAEGKPTDLTVFVRGDVNNRGPVVPRRFLRVLDAESIAFANGSGRGDLAEAIVDRANPLTARVIVNRVWARLFGRGIVGTPSNFGALGERPTHPELLDDLAVRFKENGSSLKWLHRELVLSATYRQSSVGSVASRERDPANTWLSRSTRRRLSVEQWRDGVLAVAGRLDTKNVGGKSIDPGRPDETRRTVYSRISRLELHPMLAMFDFPDPNQHSGGRSLTTTPLQMLFVLNSPWTAKQAEAFATRIRDHAADDAERVTYAHRLAFGREPTSAERSLALAYLADGSDENWIRYAHALLAANEMTHVD